MNQSNSSNPISCEFDVEAANQSTIGILGAVSAATLHRALPLPGSLAAAGANHAGSEVESLRRKPAVRGGQAAW